jgi:hypothetical protein
MIDPVSGKPLDTSQLIKLNFFKVSRHLLPWMSLERANTRMPKE